MIEELLPEIREFVKQRDWSQYHDPKNLTMALTSEVGELSQLVRWVPNTEADGWCAIPENQERLAHEVADIAITLMMLVDRLGLDLTSAVREKLEINRLNYPADQVRGRSERPPRPDSVPGT